MIRAAKKVDAEALNAVAGEMTKEAEKKVRKPRATRSTTATRSTKCAGRTTRKASSAEESAPESVKAPAAKSTSRVRRAPKRIPVSFVYRGLPGMKVFLAGDFNQWDTRTLRMLDAQENGFYSCEVMLAPGQYQYKLVINGIWREDPDNAMRIRNPYGTENNIIVVENP